MLHGRLALPHLPSPYKGEENDGPSFLVPCSALHSVNELLNLYNPRPDRGSSVFVFAFVAAPSLVKARDMPHGAIFLLVFSFFCTPAIPWRLRAWLRPQSRDLVGGEDCLSEASSAALTVGTGAKASPWGHVRAPMVLGPFAETKGPRRAGPKPRRNPLPLVTRGRNPASPSPFLSSSTLLIEDLSFCFLLLAFVAAPSNGAIFQVVIPSEARNLLVPLCLSRPVNASLWVHKRLFIVRPHPICLCSRAIPGQSQGHASWRLSFPPLWKEDERGVADMV